MYPKIEDLEWRLGEPQTKVRWSSLGCIIYNNPEPLSQARVDGAKRGTGPPGLEPDSQSSLVPQLRGHV